MWAEEAKGGVFAEGGGEGVFVYCAVGEERGGDPGFEEEPAAWLGGRGVSFGFVGSGKVMK